jgi:Domain of unknown function (DUF4328)
MLQFVPMLSAQSALPFGVRGDRSGAAQLFLGASIVAACGVVLTAWLQLRAGTAMYVPLSSMKGYVTKETLTTIAPGSFLVGAQISVLILANALQVLTSFIVAVWVHRAYANLKHLGVSTTYTPFAAAAYIVVPLANLILPHAIFDEIWRGSDPSGMRSLQRLPARPIELVSKWWYLFLAYTVTSNVAAALMMRRADPHTIQVALVAAGVAGIVAALVGIDMVRLVDTRQTIRRSGQPTRNPVAPAAVPSVPRPETHPQLHPLLQPRPQGAPPPVPRPQPAKPAPPPPPSSAWREILLPVVTQVEREMQQDAFDAELLPAFDLDEPETIPNDLEPPRARLVSALLLTAAVLAILQSLAAVTNIFETMMPRFAAFYLLFLPFALPLYAVSIAAAVVFSFWLNRAYGNLRAYMTPPRSHLDASSDFVRRGGDPEVLAELWAVTMSLSSTPSAALVERWTRAWRGSQIVAVASVIAWLVLPGRLTLAILALFFALVGWSAMLARRLVREVSATQVTRLDALAARQARQALASALPVSPEPPPFLR